MIDFDELGRLYVIRERKWQEFIPPAENIIEYVLGRGISFDQIEKFKLGGAVSISNDEVIKGKKENILSLPTFHYGKLMGIKIRKINGCNNDRYFSYKGSHKGLFNHDEVFLTTKPVLVMTGEIAVMVADRCGFLACAPTSGEWGHVDNIIKPLLLAKKIIVGDTSEIGKKTAQTRGALLDGIVRFPPEGLDWDEWALKNKEEAIRETNKWLREAQ